MIQTVCLIRNKTDDICATFILEFFKLIGCVVQDYVIKEEDRPKEIFFEEYDLNIILGSISDNNLFNMSNYSTSLILFVLIPDTANSFSWLQSQGNTLLFKEIISRVWNKPEDIQSLFILTNVYAQNNLFYFLYNKGNLKFVEEYYPVYGKSQKRITESRESAMRETFIAYAKSYNTLVESEMKQQLQSIHYDYALLLLKYKLNDMDRMLKEQCFSYKRYIKKGRRNTERVS